MEVSTLSREAMSPKLSLYPLDYRAAFAFSIRLYPQPLGLALRLAVPQFLFIPEGEALAKVKEVHKRDLVEGFGEVYLPFALEREYRNAAKESGWQYVFPAAKQSVDPRSDVIRRHHTDERILQRAVKEAIRAAGITKPGSCHTLRHASA